ncbi:MAG: putative secreted protein [Polyangiaceae bacterium]|jgi:hypothetical protein|nr:putative secreted protein [Polyangiaceae bacterium]
MKVWTTLPIFALLFAARPALADAPPHAPLPGSDGVYGRMDGLLALAADVGAEVEDGEPRGALRLSAHYLWMAGVYGRYSDAFGGAEARPARTASLGVDLRPLFLPRFSQDWERGPAFLDLAVDSLSLNAGAYFAKPLGQSFGDERGFELGAGFGLPLASHAKGPWLDFRAERRFADEGDSAWLFTASLGYHLITWSTDSARR